MTREQVVERAILIASTQRDMSKCAEEHSLYASTCRVLDESSNAFSKMMGCDAPVLAKIISKSVTPDWCMAEAAYSPFSLEELRIAVASAMRLARKELCDDELDR